MNNFVGAFIGGVIVIGISVFAYFHRAESNKINEEGIPASATITNVIIDALDIHRKVIKRGSPSGEKHCRETGGRGILYTAAISGCQVAVTYHFNDIQNLPHIGIWQFVTKEKVTTKIGDYLEIKYLASDPNKSLVVASNFKNEVVNDVK